MPLSVHKMIYRTDDNRIFLCEKNESGLGLLRVYAPCGEVEIPESLGGEKVTEIGKYCFGPKGHLREHEKELREAKLWNFEDTSFSGRAGISAVRPVFAENLESLVLPDSVLEIKDYAFYRCSRFTAIECGPALTKIAGDAFMNCRNLRHITFRADPSEPTGMREFCKLLNQEIEISFAKNGITLAKILMPEYTESYELIGPAHIFHLEVEGEGFRARKQFDNGKFMFREYDSVFEKASCSENFLTLLLMAVFRLNYPFELTENAEETYSKYIGDNEVRVMKKLGRTRDISTMENLIKSGLISKKGITAAVTESAAMGFTKETALIIRAASER